MFPASVMAKHLASVIEDKQTKPKELSRGAHASMKRFLEAAVLGTRSGEPNAVTSFRLFKEAIEPNADPTRCFEVYLEVLKQLGADAPNDVTSYLAYYSYAQAFFTRIHQLGQEAVKNITLYGVEKTTS